MFDKQPGTTPVIEQDPYGHIQDNLHLYLIDIITVLLSLVMSS